MLLKPFRFKFGDQTFGHDGIQARIDLLDKVGVFVANCDAVGFVSEDFAHIDQLSVTLADKADRSGVVGYHGVDLAIDQIKVSQVNSVVGLSSPP